MEFIKRALKAITDALFPQRCIVCNHISEDNSFFCKNCVGKIEPVKFKPCNRCGCDIKSCDCDRFFYHFDGIAAPFVNQGQARESFYAYKFYSNFSAIDYFAENMVLRFNELFGEVKIDLICFIPLSKKQLIKRRFDKCEILAQRISKLMDIPLENIILKNENIKTQHDLETDDRFQNVANAYKIIKSVKGKTILLIDDIKTTGATLDSCARELKFSGAKAVYCLTALTSNKVNS